ncbi:MAG: LptF/LptG family permease [Acidobacteriota bacterium]
MFCLIDRYILREILPFVLLSLLVLTAIIFAHEASRFTELLVVSSRKGLPLQALLELMAALAPGILVFTLPISMLVGTLVGLSRLSGDSEIIALTASGVSRFRLLRPISLLALASVSAMVYLTFNRLPQSVASLSKLKNNQSLIFQGLNTQIKPRVFEESLPKKVLYIEDIDRAQSIWHNIFIVDLGNEQGDMKIYTATSGSLRQGARSEMPELHLEQGFLHQTSSSKSSREQDSTDSSDDEQADSAQTTSADEKERGRKKNRGHQSYDSLGFQEVTLGIEVGGSNDQKAEAQKEQDIREMQLGELLAHTPPENERREWKAEIHRRLSLPAACLVFALLGVAFGINNVRAGRSFGLLLGLAITVFYYLVALWGEHQAATGRLPVWLGVWMANIILAALGITAIILQRRPGTDPLHVLASLRHMLASRKETNQQPEYEQLSSLDSMESISPERTTNSRPKRSRMFRLPQLVDRLVLGDLSRFFLYILGGFSALFLIITLFQLLEYITRNNIEWVVVADYLFFLLPMIVNYMTPIAALVAVMITFGLLQKTSQLVALKASGQSVYRIAAPVLLISVLLSAVVFFNQDYILPFTNRRQNNLRYLIRKGQEPPQTFFQTTNQWIFGLDSRIFNYAYFDLNSNTFLRLNIIDLARQPFAIKRRLYARKAHWDRQTREWVLEAGWERQFEGEKLTGYETFAERRIRLAEEAEYFRKDSRGSSSLTLAELRRKISDLSQMGFDVLDLRISLQTKFAFPLACLVMVIVGLPFSFTVGKHGALYGITIGIAIGLAYWGSLGLFEQMGRYEILPPALAAWGPNLLFGAGGLYLLLKTRT